MEEIEYLGERILRWRVGASTFLAWPERGARLMHWNISYPDGTFREVVRWPEIASPDDVAKARGGNPILFPFSARTFHEGKIQTWKDPSGAVRPMPMHGIARQGIFGLARADQTGFCARLEPDSEAREAYPYEYDFEVIYRFEERSFNVELRLTNNDSQTIPWSAGHHFYFNLPWLDGAARADYRIAIPARKAARQQADGSLAPVAAFKKTAKLSDPDLVDRIHYELTSPIVECVCEKDDSRLEIEIGTQARPHPGETIVTWTASDDAPYFCIEPWMGPPNGPEHKIGLREVRPGESDAFSVTVRV